MTFLLTIGVIGVLVLIVFNILMFLNELHDGARARRQNDDNSSF